MILVHEIKGAGDSCFVLCYPNVNSDFHCYFDFIGKLMVTFQF